MQRTFLDPFVIETGALYSVFCLLLAYGGLRDEGEGGGAFFSFIVTAAPAEEPEEPPRWHEIQYQRETGRVDRRDQILRIRICVRRV